MNDTDVWWQLKTGEIILKSGALPVRDVFTFSIPEQTRWHDSQWMFQIIAAGVFKLGGWNALIGLRALLVCVLALVLWLWLRDRGCPPVHSIGAVLIVLLASRYRLSVRPELLAFPCAALELWLFDRAARTGRLSFVPTMFIIQWFWANAHSSCIVGCFLALAFCAQDLPHNWRKPRSLIVLFGFILVSLVNPNGWIQLVYGVTEVHKSHIMELQPPGWSLVLSAMIFALLAPLGGLGVLRSRYQRFLLIVYCCFLLAALRIIRFFPYYAIAVAPLIAEAARKWRDLKPVSRSNPWRLIHAAFPVCVVMACAAVSLSNNKKKFLKMGVVEEQFPRAAADFVISRNLNGRFFNTMRDGGFLAWRFYPDRKIFVFPDTRVNNAPLERLIAINSSESMRMLISDYQIDCAIYPCYSRLPGETPDFSVF
ncbi:MAG: hypothetical protein NTY46_16280, partial [Candidatus Sumerlaeota bacterium]|nr:hypothetical protein [Candidatus Sumerlaeota bacterium]